MKKVIKIGKLDFTQTDTSEFIFTDNIGVMAVIINNDFLSKAMAQNELTTIFSWELKLILDINFENEILKQMAVAELINRGVRRAVKFMAELKNENGYLFSYMPCVTKLTYYKNY